MVVMALSFLTIISHIVAAVSALIRSVQYASALGIQGKEWHRYLQKSANLGLCYAGFGTAGSFREAWLAGEAAFLCCAYDVVTDWRHFDNIARVKFENILRARTPDSELQGLAIGLYEMEKFQRLEEGGLERGSIALRFTLKMMGCEADRELAWGDLDEIGRLLQIVDDVLDYEADIFYGDTNCLASPGRDMYLQQLLLKFRKEETRRLFGNINSVLVKVIEKARSKAGELLKTENLEASTESCIKTP
jgi:hypothetical protein